MRKRIVIAVLVITVAAVGVLFLLAETKEKGRRRRRANVVAVETAKVINADLGDRVVFTGSIKAEERYDAAPKISGIIRAVNLNVGDAVKKGDVLAVLDDDEHILAVEQAEASLLVAKATANDAKSQLEIARRDFDRIANLLRERVISAQEYDRADASLKAQEAKYETAAANVRLAEAALKTAKVKLGYTRVIADWDADSVQRVIGQRYLDAGGLVSANTPILSVLDIRTVRAVISVSEKEYSKISLNDEVVVTTDAFPGRAFRGRVSRIPQELGAYTREAEVEVAVDNFGLALKPGMFVRADIEFQRRLNTVAVPLEAVVRRDDGSRGVYLVNEEQTAVSFHPVTEGIVDGKYVELMEGYAILGREVVTLGQHLLKDGMAIRIAGDDTVSAESDASQKDGTGKGRDGNKPRGAGGA